MAISIRFNKRFKVLSQEDVDQFMELGYVHLRGGFGPEVVAAVQARVWAEMGADPQDRSTWPGPRTHLKLTIKGREAEAAYTERVRGAFDDVCGEGRWNLPDGLGWWPVSFPGYQSGPWVPPTGGWHIDGQQFHHHLTSPDQGLLPIFMFSDGGAGDGGTAIAPRSHRVTAHVLKAAEPHGLGPKELGPAVHTAPWTDIVENTGQAGDVVLLHPFMSHAASTNMGANDRVRFMCNVCLGLKEPMNLNRPDAGDYSPVERAIVDALAMPVESVMAGR